MGINHTPYRYHETQWVSGKPGETMLGAGVFPCMGSLPSTRNTNDWSKITYVRLAQHEPDVYIRT